MSLLEILSTSQPLLITFSLVLGLLVGSFLNVVIYRLPVMLQRDWQSQCQEFLNLDEADCDETKKTFNLLKPDSHCPHCNHKIRPWENIPVVSYLALGGKCSACKVAISPRYPIIEFVTGLLTALVAATFGATLLSLLLFVFTWTLITLTLIDYDHQLLPDNITLPLLWLGLLVNMFDLGLDVSLADAVIGAMAGYTVLWTFYWLFKLLTGKEGMGYGDFKLLAALGAWLGWQNLLPIIIMSSLVGAIAGVSMMLLFKREKSAPMPFGPFLASAGFIMLVWGPQLTSIYLASVF